MSNRRKDADRFINGSTGKASSCDVVGVRNDGKFILTESKGREIRHGLEQLEHSTKQLGPPNVARLELVVGRELTPGFGVDALGQLTELGKPVLIEGKRVHVTFTTQ